MANMDEKSAEADQLRKAICILNPEKGEEAKGVVHFEQSSLYSKTKIYGMFDGLKPSSKHGFHIH
jgi:hypothetical protein